jgi:putative iron-dependent peroxidase
MMSGEENRLRRREVIRATGAITIASLIAPVTAMEAATTTSEKLGGCMVHTPQAGIFALGTSSHAYLEFDILDPKKNKGFASTISSIREPRTTTGGVNFVIGFRPELWRDIFPDDAPPGVSGFNNEIRGTEGFVMPSTQHDALVWLSGSAYDVVFDMARSVIHDVAGEASLAEETSSWPYRHDRDLTGFIDGSENPTLLDAPTAALLPEGVPGAAGSVLLLQKWKHKAAEWEALPIDQQERIMGRTKPDSIELENKPANSHVARTDQDEFGHILRRNMPYGTVHNHGTMFVGFSADQKRLSRMLDSMAGLVTGTRDALTRFTQPLTGSYYFVPSVESLRRLR